MVSVVLFQEGDWWSAQCLEYDITAQAKTLPDLQYELQRVLISQMAVSIEVGIAPFEDIGPAPQRFWEMYEGAKLRLEIDETPFRLPTPGAFAPLEPRFRVAKLDPVEARAHN
ncbi:MAG TPA: hypothetical protein VJ487_01930 [Alphaproteobacteria bacterium]|nr:hypothetical protein [Alphaproteobacteria bacterium]